MYLVEKNKSLKEEVALAERKLIAHNERIESLEPILQCGQQKLTACNERIKYLEMLLIDSREKLFTQKQTFQGQLRVVRERLEQGQRQRVETTLLINSGRIAKPLRGRGNVVES
ncbi:hypothetical protein J3Q64DRAFT_1731769 [Phycomyces blakesleeanus]|uniref:Uncharacterized protein n=2 Tax=Phycomyces blakesleeanus TaxID=4837 RepID=A0A162NI61_PHYB8|nr:hypothetical protein PHYBLDRAFT_167895 [Phycomyces blakesleeanus NRRL 1555(-)]OAD74488.1 hypothetical protein PHYBLDRAFT_167895 [Phycomyces blakesleeanus NRRL 1555(-)]|eukprot:XP_018292528.1 hypothetical protein PHYBLDRAFT_167895 [Phycomyces blakesleeanus NRRL 1555(-)]